MPPKAKPTKKADDDEAYQTSAGKQKKEKSDIKRPQSSYFLFMNANRQAIKDKNPSIGFGDLTKKLTEQWKNLSAKEKAKYEKMAADDKQRYEDERSAAGEGPKNKKAQDDDAPKKPMSGYLLFGKEHRE